ncbi:ssDNA binding protein [Streptomyces phage Tomas]|uniref:SsDNA binding protein n=1 Tax=Streptomyces phage Tomas TaxID=2914443 RepID=A0AA49BTW5_9CAUD|nr:ssDNA binding protein [Streptomyces phage Tomas]UMO76271.1 ssDNA binding protein [Streptomyces phage Tomas]
MAELQGLAAIRAYKAKMAEIAEKREEQKAAGDAPRPQYLRLQDGQSVKLRFLQEMDTEARNYDPNRGVGVGEIEHQGIGNNFKYRATCTMDSEGKCWACEKVRSAAKDSEEKKYGQRKNYYINVLVDLGDGNEPQVWILSRGLNSSFVAQLMDETDEEGTITEVTYKVTRNGKGTDSTYLLRALPKDTTFDSIDFDKIETFDIKKQVLRKIPYDTDYDNKVFSQEQFYTQSAGDWKRIFGGGVDENSSGDAGQSAKPTVDSATSIDMGW